MSGFAAPVICVIIVRTRQTHDRNRTAFRKIAIVGGVQPADGQRAALSKSPPRHGDPDPGLIEVGPGSGTVGVGEADGAPPFMDSIRQIGLAGATCSGPSKAITSSALGLFLSVDWTRPGPLLFPPFGPHGPGARAAFRSRTMGESSWRGMRCALEDYPSGTAANQGPVHGCPWLWTQHTDSTS